MQTGNQTGYQFGNQRGNQFGNQRGNQTGNHPNRIKINIINDTRGILNASTLHVPAR
jgi:hypothetical protein